MRVQHPKYAALGNEGAPGFDWDLYEGGWNGKTLKVNEKIRTKKGSKEHVYSHEPYAQALYNKLSGVEIDNVKDAVKGTTWAVNNISLVDDETLSVTVGNGAKDVLVDLNKENSFLRIFTDRNGNPYTRTSFVNAFKSEPSFKQDLLNTKLMYVKFGTDTEKGSIWDGHVDMLNRELKAQIELSNKAYMAKVIETNGGGFVVEIMNTLRAFMPGSMAASNRITDYESFIGREMEVMVESWNPRYGFVVSRKKYLNKVRPYKVQPIVDELQKNPDKIYTGRVTGSTYFGVFVELDEFITGMLHKTLASDQMRQAMRDNTIEEGSEIQVYVHAVEGTRVIFSDVPLAERDAVIAKREEEEAKEMAERPQNAEQQQKPSGYAGYRPRQFGERRYNVNERTQRRDEQQSRRRYSGKKEASQSDLDRLAAHFNK